MPIDEFDNKNCPCPICFSCGEIFCLPLFLFCRERNPRVHCSRSKVQSTRYSARQKRTSRSRMRKQFLLFRFFLSLSLFVFFLIKNQHLIEWKRKKMRRVFRSMMKKKKKEKSNGKTLPPILLADRCCPRAFEY